MAENKKSFIAYCEWIEVFEELSDEDAGKLIKHIFKYVNDQDPKADNPLVKLAFIPIKQHLKRDLKKYETYIEKQRANGSKGGRPKETQKTQPFIKKPKKADNVNVNDNVNDTSTKVDEDSLLPTSKLKEIYLDNPRIIGSVIKTLGVKDKDLENLLDDFNEHLDTQGINAKKWLDYTSHFLSWARKIKKIKEQPDKKTGAMDLLRQKHKI